MDVARHLVRQAILAALTLLPLSAVAEVTARFDRVAGTVLIDGLEPHERARVLADPALLRLQVTGLQARRGMPVSVAEADAAVVVKPRFALRAGTDYTLIIEDEGKSRILVISVPAPKAPKPTVIAFAPSQSVIPANTLRLYLEFSTPMARGQVRRAISLWRGDGTKVESPFLALGPELWDRSQTRVTLLLDPGRIKQGVGPNLERGAPLEPGETYRLVVSDEMESAAGVPLGTVAEVVFRVGPAERRAITPETWQVLSPPAGSQAPLTVAFDRIIDSGTSRRLLQVQDANGQMVRGQIVTDGGGWSLTPEHPWRSGTFRLVVDPQLEDVSGNTPAAAFDARAGAIGAEKAPVVLTLDIN